MCSTGAVCGSRNCASRTATGSVPGCMCIFTAIGAGPEPGVPEPARYTWRLPVMLGARLIPLLLIGVASAAAQSPAIPDTPAGHTMQAWLDAFNSGDRPRIQAYLTKYEPTKPLDATVAF